MNEMAGMISDNFTRINQQFSKIDQRFDTVERVLEDFKEETKQQFRIIDENFRQVRRDILNQDLRFPTLYAFDQLSGRVEVLEEESKVSDRLSS
jgi:hypothetical protein